MVKNLNWLIGLINTDNVVIFKFSLIIKKLECAQISKSYRKWYEHHSVKT